MRVLDERGRRCPLPVIALARAAAVGGPGDELAVLSDDPAARLDVPAWCRMRGHAFVGEEPADGGGVRLAVRLGGPTTGDGDRRAPAVTSGPPAARHGGAP